MSLKVQVDIERLLLKLEEQLCEKCRQKLLKMTVPITQSLTVADLVPQLKGGKPPRQAENKRVEV